MALAVAQTEERLDERQRAAVEHAGGPLLVLGSPGTGKSHVLVERWVRLAADTGAPHRVLLLVANRQRALELRDALPWRLPGRALIEVPAHTWHAFAYHLVTRYYRPLGYAEPPILLTAPEQWAVVRDLLLLEDPKDWAEFGDHLTSRAFVDEVADFCLRAGWRGATDAELRELTKGRADYAAVVTFVERYRARLAAACRLDYAGLLGAAAHLLAEHPEIAEAVRGRFPHVLVDDAHELTAAQLRLLQHLQTRDLVAAGDPDSAIETFRGAEHDWLARFDDVVGAHETIVLDSVHRHGEAIGRVAHDLIDRHGAPDGAHRARAWAGPAGPAHARAYATLTTELEAIARELRAANLHDGVPYDRMAVLLAQPGAYVPPLRRTLDQFSVPYRLLTTDRPLSAEPACRAVLDLCRVALTDAPDDLVWAVLSSPIVGCDPHHVRELRRERFKKGRRLDEVLAEDQTGEVAEFRRLRDLVAGLRAGGPGAAGLPAGVADADPADDTADWTLHRLLEASGWYRSLKEAFAAGEREARRHVDALRALSRALARFVERRHGGTMREYLLTSAQADFSSETVVPEGDGVAILSLHAAKGLEWDIVCVAGVAEGQIPKPTRAQGLFDPWALETGSAVQRAQAQVAEERRTLYVALTRAARRLVVTTSPGLTARAQPSRFFEEAFGVMPEPVSGLDAPAPLTLAEAVGAFRRTLALPEDVAPRDEKVAAACALARAPGLDTLAWWWRREWTPGAALTPSGKLTTSYSRIGTYDNCPLQYVYTSVLGLDPETTYQMKFGSLVHRIIERVERGEIAEWADAVAVYKAEFDPTDYPNVVFARTYYAAGIEMLKLWWRSERVNGETVAVEYAFNDLELDGHVIRGRIDRVARHSKGLVLVDYKTSRSMLAWEDAKQSLQLAIYYLAARTYDDLKRHGDPHAMQLVYPGVEDFKEPGQPAKRYQRPEQAEETLEKLKTILADAAAEKFDPSPHADCQWCRMRPMCPRWPEGREVGP